MSYLPVKEELLKTSLKPTIEDLEKEKDQILPILEFRRECLDSEYNWSRFLKEQVEAGNIPDGYKIWGKKENEEFDRNIVEKYFSYLQNKNQNFQKEHTFKPSYRELVDRVYENIIPQDFINPTINGLETFIPLDSNKATEADYERKIKPIIDKFRENGFEPENERYVSEKILKKHLSNCEFLTKTGLHRSVYFVNKTTGEVIPFSIMFNGCYLDFINTLHTTIHETTHRRQCLESSTLERINTTKVIDYNPQRIKELGITEEEYKKTIFNSHIEKLETETQANLVAAISIYMLFKDINHPDLPYIRESLLKRGGCDLSGGYFDFALLSKELNDIDNNWEEKKKNFMLENGKPNIFKIYEYTKELSKTQAENIAKYCSEKGLDFNTYANLELREDKDPAKSVINQYKDFRKGLPIDLTKEYLTKRHSKVFRNQYYINKEELNRDFESFKELEELKEQCEGLTTEINKVQRENSEQLAKTISEMEKLGQRVQVAING